MGTNKLKSSLLAAIAAGIVLAASGAPGAMAGPLVLNPSNTNSPGCLNVSGGACGAIDSLFGAFSTDGASVLFTSDLQIGSAPNASTVPASIAAKEVGSLGLTNFSLANVVNNFTTGLCGVGALCGIPTASAYYLYAQFTIAGAGHWSAIPGANEFILDTSSPSTLISLYAVPNGSPAPSFTVASQTSFGSTTPFGSDILLGTAIVTGLTGGQTNATVNGSGTTAGTSLGADLTFIPRPGTTGPNGFFQNVIAAVLIHSSDSSNGNEVTESLQGFGTDSCSNPTLSGGCTDLVTAFGIANGTLTFNVVPEPASLSLLGGGLLAMAGFVRRRRRSRSKTASA